MFSNAYHNRPVFITGHTGFKGSWLTQWLLNLGAKVSGFALTPEPHERLFDQLKLSPQLVADVRGDVGNHSDLCKALQSAHPDFVFHLAAQPLVRKSFDIPVETFATNVMGTVNLLDAIRTLNKPCSVVVVTTDKCYENREWLHAYREEDAMGGYDPYSASKGCAELVTAAYRRSYFSSATPIAIASARAGNVVGGGDWAIDRIVPDIFRAVFDKQPIPVRNRNATRPWQHVLEPLSGYLWLGASLDLGNSTNFSRKELASGFNFGPSLASNRTVLDVVQGVLQYVDGSWDDRSDPNAPHEASKLNLAIDKAFHMLSWVPTWDFDETIKQTVSWYTAANSGHDIRQLTSNQIDHYTQSAAKSNASWA